LPIELNGYSNDAEALHKALLWEECSSPENTATLLS